MFGYHGNACLKVMLLTVFSRELFKMTTAASNKLALDFEVFGRVQGVFFRKYTQQEAKKLGLRGWCMNTDGGTVQGVIEGDESKIKAMKAWLQKQGSPSSKIEKAIFKNERLIDAFTFSNFSIKK